MCLYIVVLRKQEKTQNMFKLINVATFLALGWGCMCVYVCMYVYIYILHIYIYIYTHTYMCIYIYIERERCTGGCLARSPVPRVHRPVYIYIYIYVCLPGSSRPPSSAPGAFGSGRLSVAQSLLS